MRRLLWVLLLLGSGAALLYLAGEDGRTRPPEPPPEPAAPTPGRCTAVTRGGSRCTRRAEPGSRRCWQHA